MQVSDDANDAFLRILQTLAGLMSQHTDDREIDGKNLSQCDEELDALGSVQKQLERRVASVRRKRNTFAPVNSLPPELATVFDIVIGSNPVKVWSNLGTLMLACHHWNQLVKYTPSLWTKIQGSAKTSNVIITRVLEISQDSPLDVDYDGTGGSRALDHQHAFLSTIFPHAHRWRKAALSIQGAAQALEPMATLSSPLLESLSLRAIGGPSWANEEPLDVFGGRPPARLQELSLDGIPIKWSPKTICNLKALEIRDIHRLGPSLDQLFAILSASPNLESLSIDKVNFSGGASAPIHNLIQMPALGTLWLELISPWTINRILAALRAPNCNFGSLRPRILVDPFETLFTPDVSHFFDHIRSGANSSSVYCREGEVTMSWDQPWRIYLEVKNIRVARRVLDWMSVSPELNPPVVSLCLTIGVSDPLMVEDILAVMTDTKAVHRVEFLSNVPLTGAFGMLTTGGLEEGDARTPFPGLREVFIYKSLDDDEWENLVRVFRSRQGVTEARDGDQHPSPLRSLELGEEWDIVADEAFITQFRSIHWLNRLEEVRRLLGHDGKLRWYQFMVTEDGTLEEQPRGDWSW
ncbi:hypothetical protein FS837_007231 [Tulasnella sp. UAMH 9824]|nr:hypothetical protein FS837_007231 [Tulasnella sp. UAMH 9824]